jgi:phospholipid/cholesterol/gamma-HCH transport system ATP-binding protein
MNMIEIIDAQKSFGDKQIIKDLNLEIKKGETLVIIGGSGTGKSVTLKLIMGTLTPDSGEIRVNGKNIWGASDSLSEARLQMGVLFQGSALLNSLSIFDNVALPLVEHTDMSRSEIRSKVLATLKLVDMDHAHEKLPAEISGGMAKRAGLARAIVRDPEIILYDEPTSGLDPVMSHVIDNLCLSMQEKLNVTSIVVTHDMTSAYRIADRIAYLYDGKVEVLGSPEEIQKSDNPRLKQFITGAIDGPLTEALIP